MSAQRQETQFEKYYQKGRFKLVEDKNYDEALELFLKARRNFNSTKDEFYRLVDLMIDESRIFKDRRQFGKAEQKIRACQEQVRKRYQTKNNGGAQHMESKQYKVKLLSQRTQILMAETDNFAQKNQNQKFIEKINECAENYAKAIDVIASVLVDCHKLNRDEIQTWEQLYAETIISSIDPIIAEAQKGNQSQSLFELIYQIGQKMARFYKLSCKIGSLARQNSRSLYYRGTMLLKTSAKYSQIEKFLIKDYEFCRRYNYKDDLQKTRSQLFNYYVKIERLDQARKYLRTDEQKKIFSSQIVGDMTRLKKFQQQIKSPHFLTLQSQIQLQKLQNVYNIVSDEQNNWWPRFISIARFILPQLKKREVNFYVCLKTAQCYYQGFDELNAIHFCNQAFKYCESSQERYQVLFLMMEIYQKVNKPQKLIQVENELKLIVFKKAQVQEHIDNRNFEKKRYQVLSQKLLCSDKQKDMFQALQRFVGEKTNKQVGQNDMIESQNNNMAPTFMRVKQEYKNCIKKQRKQILQDTYQRNCVKEKIDVRLPILRKIQSMNTDDMFISVNLSQYFELSTAQLQVYLEIVRNQEWDLRNFDLQQSFLKKFVQKIPFNEVKVFKVCSISRQIRSETIQRLLFSLNFVQQLHLETFDRKFTGTINKLLIEDFSDPFSNLRILKLKNCRIVDENILTINLAHPQLTQLDLAGNQITGKSLTGLNKMRSLQKLNLSYNPLQVVQLENPSLTKLKLKNLKHFDTGSKMLLPQIKFLHILDISQNRPEALEVIMRNNRQYLLQEQFLELPNFIEMRVKKSNITEQFLGIFNEFINFCLGFQKLDIRFSHYDPIKLQSRQKYWSLCGKNFSIDARAFLSQPHLYKL